MPKRGSMWRWRPANSRNGSPRTDELTSSPSASGRPPGLAALPDPVVDADGDPLDAQGSEAQRDLRVAERAQLAAQDVLPEAKMTGHGGVALSALEPAPALICLAVLAFAVPGEVPVGGDLQVPPPVEA